MMILKKLKRIKKMKEKKIMWKTAFICFIQFVTLMFHLWLYHIIMWECVYLNILIVYLAHGFFNQNIHCLHSQIESYGLYIIDTLKIEMFNICSVNEWNKYTPIQYKPFWALHTEREWIVLFLSLSLFDTEIHAHTHALNLFRVLSFIINIQLFKVISLSCTCSLFILLLTV